MDSTHPGPPGSVVLASVVANACQLVQILAIPIHPIALVGLGFTVVGGLLLVSGRSLGWFLTMFWAASVISAPILFDAALWPALVGVFVVGMLAMPDARKYCLGPSRASATSIHPILTERKLVARMPEVMWNIEVTAPTRIRRSVEKRVPRSWLRRRNVFLFFLGSTLVLLPLSGLAGKLDRGSGRGDPLVDVAYHVVSFFSTLALIGMIVTLFLMLRTLVR